MHKFLNSARVFIMHKFFDIIKIQTNVKKNRECTLSHFFAFVAL